ncbi:hypothetical protein GGS23DRAFT_166324 [Durotheca rogersii]|uniref:uncharacterized protein n=1 Tax=Durotheca rogersii TaxID=419775 RepID=UPI00222011F9|nr:uncharacterized protein GGS23DRAFT_166324 [Durotheca rogersii]KAI5867216.1 hypothetical protein GGS23DRAFT_166324 [Durotheca rogersii]
MAFRELLACLLACLLLLLLPACLPPPLHRCHDGHCYCYPSTTTTTTGTVATAAAFSPRRRPPTPLRHPPGDDAAGLGSLPPRLFPRARTPSPGVGSAPKRRVVVVYVRTDAVGFWNGRLLRVDCLGGGSACMACVHAACRHVCVCVCQVCTRACVRYARRRSTDRHVSLPLPPLAAALLLLLS